MQPFINPSYLYQNPYFSNFGNSFLQNTQNSYNGINGKYVNDFSEITASDVPMGGQPSIFVRNDRSEVQLREWSPNGQIISTVYVPYIDTKQQEKQPESATPQIDVNTEIIAPIFEKISVLEEKLDKLSKPVTVTRAKKDGE